MGQVKVVNVVPNSLSGEANQDSEPNIAVNPANVSEMVATAFTPAPLGGSFAPIYISTDGGNTWALRTVIPGNGQFGTGDITVAFATTGGMLYAGTLNGNNVHLNILRTSAFTSTTPLTVLVDRANEDQPWVVAGSVVVGGTSKDRVFVGNNDFNQPSGGTATIDVSQDAATNPAPAGFAPIQLEHASTSGQDGPPIRTALHSDGTVYSAFERWDPGSANPNLNVDVVVTRDDNWGAGTPPFQALGANGTTVASNRFMVFNAVMGQERLGADLAIAVDPNNSSNVWIAWCDRVGGRTGTDWTGHVSHSTDKGATWSADVRTITNIKNPSLAVNSNGQVGFVYQAFTGSQWVTTFEVTSNAWSTPAETHVLHQASSSTPARSFFPYIGDYIRLLAVGADFYGVFCGNNTPDMANFPSGVTYQRNANFSTHQLLASDGVTNVAVSIDPFFFSWTQLVVPIITRKPGPIVSPGPIARGPITPGPIARGPITPGPISREPPAPIDPLPGPDPPAPPAQGAPTDLQL
jgi:hypothetical protein